jgi:hypothetical protein
MADSIPFDRVIWNAQDCADYFKQSRQEFLRITRHMIDFPKELPSRPRHWRALEVRGWKPTKLKRQTCVYRHWSADNRLLYVGISLTALLRMARHAGDSRWFDQVAKITIERYDTRAEALAVEKRAIGMHKPPFNVKHRG